LDNYLIGTMRTKSSDSHITDSAAAASAMATGFKTYNDAVSVFPDTKKSAGTIMEAAKAAGWSTGIVTTTGVYDASGAAFTAHSESRTFHSFIAHQQVQKKLDVILGGGRVAFRNETIELALKNGYHYVQNKTALANATLPVLGLFAERDLASVLERDLFPEEPDLYNMTAKALELLRSQKESKGFFLFIENEDTDNFAHLSDFSTVYKSILDMERTINLVMDFAKRNNDTLVLISSDHETAGLGLGLRGLRNFNSDALKSPTRSARYSATQLLGEKNITTVHQKVKEFTGFNITDTEAEECIQISDDIDLLEEYFGMIVTKRAQLGITTNDHTAVDVNVYGYGPSVERFCGNFDNTQIAKRIAKLFDWDVDKITEELRDFIPHP